MMVHEDPGAPQTALAAMFAPDVLPLLAPCAQALPAHREPQTPQDCQVPQTGPPFSCTLSAIPAVRKGSTRT